MPLDNPRENPHQRLMDLEDKLRRGEFPFTWDFRGCKTCAMAVDRADGNWSRPGELAGYYGISSMQAFSIFADTGGYNKIFRCEVTSEMVADRIHEVLERVLA